MTPDQIDPGEKKIKVKIPSRVWLSLAFLVIWDFFFFFRGVLTFGTFCKKSSAYGVNSLLVYPVGSQGVKLTWEKHFNRPKNERFPCFLAP